jgi:hypothetical protein
LGALAIKSPVGFIPLEDELNTLPDGLEVRVSPAGAVFVIGWATVDRLDDLLMDGVGTSPKACRIR